LNRKATFTDLIVVVALVSVAFLLCMGDKTLVGFLLLVPLAFLLIGIPWVLMIWIERIASFFGPGQNPVAQPAPPATVAVNRNDVGNV